MSYFRFSVSPSQLTFHTKFSVATYTYYYSLPPIVWEEKSRKFGKQGTKPQRHWVEEAGNAVVGKRDWLCGNDMSLNGGIGQLDAGSNGDDVVWFTRFWPRAIAIAVTSSLCIPKFNVARAK